jgi:hypothetical protein
VSSTEREMHWQNVYATKAANEVSWYQENPAPSLDLIAATGIAADAAIIDVGGGASRLVDALLDRGFHHVTILDLSAGALEEAPQSYDLWHDRAAFHFLTEAADRDAYAARLKKAVRSGGHIIIATFAPDGPERCSGLPVVRYDPDALARTLGLGFELVESRRHDHVTPEGNTQRFQFSRFVRQGTKA